MFHTPFRLIAIVGLAATAALFQGPFAPLANANPQWIDVPGDYATIQAAINAAAPGETIRVRKGTYTEQLVIKKDLSIIGAGMDKTVVQAPVTLELNQLGRTSIVEIFDGASVDMSRLTVAGPASGACGVISLSSGIRVHGEAHLDFSWAAVRDIRSSPMGPCGGSGIVVGEPVEDGEPPPPTASVSIQHAVVTNYQSTGVLVLGAGSVGNVTHSIIRGPGAIVGTNGIELVAGAVGTIAYNVISGNVCPPADDSCGTDWFSVFQNAGIIAGGGGPGTVVTHNLVFGNQIGIFLSEVDEFSHNLMVNNSYFGLAIVDGDGVDNVDVDFEIEHSIIRGGGGGVWAIGLYANTTVTFDHLVFSGLSGPQVEILDDDPGTPQNPEYTVTIIGWP